MHCGVKLSCMTVIRIDPTLLRLHCIVLHIIIMYYVDGRLNDRVEFHAILSSHMYVVIADNFMLHLVLSDPVMGY